MLNLFATSQFTDVAYQSLATLPLLEDLDLCGAGKISTQSVAAIAEVHGFAPTGSPPTTYLPLANIDCGPTLAPAANRQPPPDAHGRHPPRPAHHLALHPFQGCPNMRRLNLTWCVQVDDHGIMAVATHCKRLELLSVYGLKGVTDQSIALLAAPGGCAGTLRTLDVHGCCNVSFGREEGGGCNVQALTEALLERFPKLTCFLHHS